jgi:hypothetical protein
MKFVKAFVVAAAVSASLNVEAASVNFSMDPSSSTINGLGQTFSVNILGDFNPDDVENLLGGALDLHFDSSVLNVVSVNVTAPQDIAVNGGAINNVAGVVDTMGFSTFAGVNGNFNFATVEFMTVGLGNSALTLADANDLVFNFYSDKAPFGEAVSVNATGANVSVVPLPAAAWLFGSALLAGAGILRRKQA